MEYISPFPFIPITIISITLPAEDSPRAAASSNHSIPSLQTNHSPPYYDSNNSFLYHFFYNPAIKGIIIRLPCIPDFHRYLRTSTTDLASNSAPPETWRDYFKLDSLIKNKISDIALQSDDILAHFRSLLDPSITDVDRLNTYVTEVVRLHSCYVKDPTLFAYVLGTLRYQVKNSADGTCFEHSENVYLYVPIYGAESAIKRLGVSDWVADYDLPKSNFVFGHNPDRPFQIQLCGELKRPFDLRIIKKP